jgi:hypothetical protein
MPNAAPITTSPTAKDEVRSISERPDATAPWAEAMSAAASVTNRAATVARAREDRMVRIITGSNSLERVRPERRPAGLKQSVETKYREGKF